jgi:hypothetical protein
MCHVAKVEGATSQGSQGPDQVELKSSGEEARVEVQQPVVPTSTDSAGGLQQPLWRLWIMIRVTVMIHPERFQFHQWNKSPLWYHHVGNQLNLKQKQHLHVCRKGLWY